MRDLYAVLAPRHGRKVAGLFLVQVAAAVSEVASVGAILPFLAVLVDGQSHGASVRDLGATHLPLPSGFRISPVALGVAFIFVIVLSNVLRLAAIRLQYRFASSIGTSLASEVYRKILSQSYEYHSMNNSNVAISLCSYDAMYVATAVIPALFYLGTNALVVLFLALALTAIDPLAAVLAAVIVGSAYVAIHRVARERLQSNGRHASLANGRAVKALQEGLGGIRDVLLDGTQGVFVEAYRRSIGETLGYQASSNVISMRPRFLIEPLVVSIIVVYSLVLARGEGGLVGSIPALGALALGVNRLLPALQQAYASFAVVRSGRAPLANVASVLGLTEGIDHDAGAGAPLQWREIRLSTVSYRYPGGDDAWILRNVDLLIRAGETLAIVGRTGSGKSTLGDLLLGLLRPVEGAISVDGLPLEGERLEAWQRQVAHVPQEIFLADSSFAANIAFGVEEKAIDMQRVRAAARAACIDEFIEGQEGAYSGFVGERGIRLSGGQRQRIGIARALYKRASFIVLDEATSALDGSTEKEVMAAIENLRKRVTLVIIAHRTSTVLGADRILKVESGRVRQISRAELQEKAERDPRT